MEINKHVTALLLCCIAQITLSMEKKVNNEAGTFARAIEIITDKKNNHPHKAHLKQIINDFYIQQSNPSISLVSDTAQKLAQYLNETPVQESANTTMLATMEDDRKKIIVFGNVLNTLNNFENAQQSNNNISSLQVVKPYMNQFATTMDNYFAGNNSTPTAIESITKADSQLKALVQAQKNQAQQEISNFKKPATIARASQPKPENTNAQIPHIIKNLETLFLTEMEQTKKLDQELDAKIISFDSNLTNSEADDSVFLNNMRSKRTVGDQIITAHTTYRNLDKKIDSNMYALEATRKSMAKK